MYLDVVSTNHFCFGGNGAGFNFGERKRKNSSIQVPQQRIKEFSRPGIALPTCSYYNITRRPKAMSKFKAADIVAAVCFIFALTCIDFDKNAIKSLITGGVIAWWITKRLK